MKFRSNLLAAVACNAMLAVPGLAQDGNAADAADDMILVTSQRYEQSVQDVPIPVTVVAGDQLQNQGVQEIADLGRVAASLQMANNPGGSGGGGYIRGVGTYSRSRGAEPSVGIVVDGVVQGLTNIRNLSDIQRVEVLRGPQGTLFGQSVSAGVINISSIAPELGDFSGRAAIEVSGDDLAGSNYGRQVGRLALNVPVTDNSALRVSGYSVRTDGVLENIWTGEDDLRKEWGVRGRYLVEMTETARLNLIAEYSRDLTLRGGFPTIREVLSTGPNSAARFAACGMTPSIDNFEICSDAPQRGLFVIQGYSGQLDVDLSDSLAVTAITAFRSLESETNNDIDNLPDALSANSQRSGLTSDYEQFTQEIRLASDPLAPVSFTVGGFYFLSEVDTVQGPSVGGFGLDFPGRGTLNTNLGAAAGLAACYPVATVASCNTTRIRGQEQAYLVEIENLSAFGEVRYAGEGFAVFAGARYTNAVIDQSGTFQAVSPTVGVLRSSLVHNEEDVLTWRVGGQYDVTEDVMLFATASRGFKQAQVAQMTGSTNAILVAPEKPMSYELGFKANTLDNRLNFNVSAFCPPSAPMAQI